MNSQVVEVKVELGSCVKLLKTPNSYDEWLKVIANAFSDTLKGTFKIHYRDADEDLIIVNTEDDYQIALNEVNNPNFTFLITPDEIPKEEVKKNPNLLVEGASKVESLYVNQSDPLTSSDNKLEESKTKEEKKSNFQVTPEPKKEKTTPEEKKPETVKQQQATPKGLTEIPNPKKTNIPVELNKPKQEMSKEQSENPKGLPENNKIPPTYPKTQEKPESPDIYAEEIENKPIQTNEEEKGGYACLSCEGKKVNKKGTTCSKCKGSGKMNNALQSNIEKMIFQQVSKAVQLELEKQTSILQQSNRIDEILQSVVMSNVVSQDIKCKSCQKKILLNDIMYSCPICTCFYLCEICEVAYMHEHNLIKNSKSNIMQKSICQSGSIPPYSVSFSNGIKMKKDIKQGNEFTLAWKARNNGTVGWPKDTKIVPVTLDHFSVKECNVGSVPPGKEIDIELKMIAPNKVTTFTGQYQLASSGRKFGEKIVAEINVQKAMTEMEEKIERFIKNNDLEYPMTNTFREAMKLLCDWDLEEVFKFVKEHPDQDAVKVYENLINN